MYEHRASRAGGQGGTNVQGIVESILQHSAWPIPGAARLSADDVISQAEQEGPKAEVQGCPGGCDKFSQRGCNAYVDVKTREKYGKQEKTKKEVMETNEASTCPQEIADFRGSSGTTSRGCCLQCKQAVHTRDQDEQLERNKVIKDLGAKGAPGTMGVTKQAIEREDIQLTKDERLACVERLASDVNDMPGQAM